MNDSNIVIRVEGLGKKYALRHEARTHNTTLRDVLANATKTGGRLFNPFSLAGFIGRGQRQTHRDRTRDQEEFWALRDVSFEIYRGERVGIIGRNGAGKSTLLKILSRITEPTTGRVEIHGRVASLLEVGTGFHPELTGRENIYLNGAILGMARKEIRAKFDEIVSFSDVERFLDTPVKRYSSGMYVRLAFAVAAHLEPELLIVDEVLAVGDFDFQKKCLGKMQSVAGQGRTVLFVSHNLQAVERLCTRAIYMKDGGCVYDGTTSTACEKYLDQGREWKGRNRIEGKEHSGSLEARITQVEVLDVYCRPVDTIASGEPIRIRIHYSTNETIRDPWFGITVLTTNGTRVFNSISSDINNDICEVSGDGWVEVEVSDIALAPGHYLMNIALSRRDGSYIDHVSEVPFIDITNSRVLPSKRTYNQKSGLVFLPARWKQCTRSQ